MNIELVSATDEYKEQLFEMLTSQEKAVEAKKAMGYGWGDTSAL